ncbi:alpha/beta hydrolase family protein [Gordonia defluvii]|jgi:S-formylglutathione hydrolase FrmB|uniref:Alpha/beta hydrolase family protein n=1 Tax=Gordonia defluvii TaxID=283718 RepID=A0ABN3YDR7_9ACTN|nr:alpha/beta hydrolase family protein [Gordonia sp. UBA5067]
MAQPTHRLSLGVVLMALLSGMLGIVAAGPAVAERSPARIVKVEATGPQRLLVSVYSPAMKRNIPLDVLVPKGGRPAPTLYLLNGAAGGEGEGNWADKTSYASFFANKHVNVVTPLEGKLSYYTDWLRYDPKLGLNKWETFLTRELPPVLDARLHATGKNAVAGLSMSGTSALNLAVVRPHFYRAVASFSGCARTSDPIGQEYIRQVVEGRGGGNVTNMWGPLGGPDWVRHDPYVNAANLRGTSIYMSAMTGLPGQDEQLGPKQPLDGELVDRVIVGGGIEAAMDHCTQDMAKRLAQLRIPATIVIRPAGTHSWGYWEREMKYSWPQIRRALR